jgi:hypothetical protein
MVDRRFLSPFLEIYLFFFVLSLVQTTCNSAHWEGMYMGSEILHTHFYKTHLRINASVSASLRISLVLYYQTQIHRDWKSYYFIAQYILWIQ